MELNTINKTGTWSETADRINSNFSKISIEVEEIKQNGGGGSGGGGGDVTNADHANSAYTLDKDTPVQNWFLSALNDDDAQGIINFLKGLKIAGNLINRIVKQGDKDVTYTDEDVMSALRVMTEIENSAEKLKEIFLRKDVADSTKYLLSLLGGVLIKKYAKFGDFVTGVSGGYIDEKGDMEMGSGVFRKRLFVPEIAYNRTTYFKGRMVNSPGGGCSVLSYVDNGDGTYTITPDLTDADGLSQFVDDILTTYFVTKNSEGKLNGFEEMKFRVTAADYTAKKFTVIPRPGHSDWKPAEQMVLAQTGNFTDPERQTYILIDSVNGNNCITFFDNANTWDPEPAQMPAWFGKKKGMTVAGINADNYSAVLQNIIMTGLIFQVDEITGQTVRVPLDKGEWTAGKYAYYNRVSHNGALWLCVDDNGTTTEPSDDNPAWLKQVDKGDKGDPGLSVVGGGHWESANTPYSANTMVTLANCVFISKVETSNPPIRILRIKGGNFLRKKDGGYYLAGKPADWEVNEDWDMLLDGRELKGESITFLGEFATAPANPKNGDSYRNTTDRATYIYQDGRWQLMISDGKDGKGYEYIYTRGNIIDNTPEKPDSQQKDGYVPEGWTDNYLGTDIDHQVEWGCTRFKENGVWSEFSDPAVVHRWSKDGAQVINHPQSNELNAMLYEKILELQAIELSYWKRGLESNLSTLKEAVKKGIKPVVSFLKFAIQAIENSDRKPGTKDNMLGTVATLKEFRNVIEFTDINYTFLKEFDAFLRNKGLKVNTVGKHMRILRTLVNEAINEGYILQEAYPFRKFKIKKEKKEHNFLMPADLEKLENLELPDRKNNSRHILDAFLFCCYCGLRFSDFKQLTYKNLVTVDGKEWLVMNSIKTGVKLNIPLYLLFNGKALGIMRKYDSIEQLAALGCNSDTNRTLQKLGRMARISKKFTYHTSRHTCATLLVHQGVPITTVQKLLGHTSVKTTEIYSEVFDETIIKDLTRANQKYSKSRNVKQNQIKSQKYPEKYLRQ